MKYRNNVSRAKLDQFKKSKGFIKFRVEYIEQPFVKNIKDLDTYKYDTHLEESYIYSFNIDGNLLQINLVMDINKLIILPIVKLKGEGYFNANFYTGDACNNKMVSWFIELICEEFFDTKSESILGGLTTTKTLWETTEKFKDMIRDKQSLREFEYNYYYTEIGSLIMTSDYKGE